MIKKFVMALSSRYAKPKVEESKTDNEVTLKLTKGELEALLIGLGEATFKGKHVESVYKLAVKLQLEIDKLK
jgi:hypothetical protein